MIPVDVSIIYKTISIYTQYSENNIVIWERSILRVAPINTNPGGCIVRVIKRQACPSTSSVVTRTLLYPSWALTVSRLLWHHTTRVRAYKCYSHTTRPVCRERSPFTTPCSSKGCLPTAHPPGWIRTSIGTHPSLPWLSCFDLIKSCSSVHD